MKEAILLEKNGKIYICIFACLLISRNIKREIKARSEQSYSGNTAGKVVVRGIKIDLGFASAI